MKHLKRVLLLSAAISGAFTAGVYAQDVLQRVDAYLRPDFNLVVDGKPVQLERPTLIYNDDSYLPVAELGRMLGANIYWRGDTKTIYINNRINPEQRTDEEDQLYETIQMYNPYSVTLSYLGSQYPMLITSNNFGGKFATGLYYRLSDVKRMGIDTDGLKKAKERYTDDLFVSEKELQKRWGQKPVQVYSPAGVNYVISEEVHPKKIEALRNLVKSTQTVRFDNKVTLNDKPIIIDKVAGEEDNYDYLVYGTMQLQDGTFFNRYYRARVTLEKKTIGAETSYTASMKSRIDLQSEAEKRDNP